MTRSKGDEGRWKLELSCQHSFHPVFWSWLICNQSYLSWRYTSTLESQGDTVFAGDTRTTPPTLASLGCSAEQEISSIHGSIRLFSWRQIWVTARASEPARSPSHSFPASSSACVPLVPLSLRTGKYVSEANSSLYLPTLATSFISPSLDLIPTNGVCTHTSDVVLVSIHLAMRFSE